MNQSCFQLTAVKPNLRNNSGHMMMVETSSMFFSIFSAFKEKGKQTFQEIRFLTQLKNALYVDILQQYDIECPSFFSNSSLFSRNDYSGHCFYNSCFLTYF